MYIAIDFDKTIVVNRKGENRWWSIKRNKFLAKKVINYFYDRGHTILINSMREDKVIPYINKRKKFKSKTDAIKWLKKSGIKYNYFNENPKELVEKWGDSRKIACDVNIDDRNIVPLVNWPIIFVLLKIREWCNPKSTH